MPKPLKKLNPVRAQVIGDLIATTPTSWERKVLGKDAAGKETVETVKVTHQALRFPLAQNVSEENVERLAGRWL